MLSRVSHFLFARASSENLHHFAQFVNASLRARQKKLRRLQEQSPDSIFSDAEGFPTELSNSDLPILSDEQFPRNPENVERQRRMNFLQEERPEAVNPTLKRARSPRNTYDSELAGTDQRSPIRKVARQAKQLAGNIVRLVAPRHA